MSKIEFEIKDIGCGLKMDKWIDGIQPKNPAGYKKQAEEKVYRDNKKNISIPAVAIKACMRLASSEVGKKMQAKKNRQTISSAVFIEPSMLPLNKKKYDYIVEDVVTRGNGSKVTRVKTYRPFVNGWVVKGVINSFGVPIEFIRECLELGGMRYGLLSHRPEFGRFIITKFQEVKK